MFGLLSDLWHQGVTQRFFQQVLDVGIALLPPAQAGSIMLRHEQDYRYIAAWGYNLQALSKVTLPARVLDVLLTADWSAFCLHDLDGLNADHLDRQSQRILHAAGRTDAIQETLVIPIRQPEQTLAVLTLDNCDGVGAFHDRDIVMAQRLYKKIGVRSRVQATRWALEHGLIEPHNKIDTSLPSAFDDGQA